MTSQYRIRDEMREVHTSASYPKQGYVMDRNLNLVAIDKSSPTGFVSAMPRERVLGAQVPECGVASAPISEWEQEGGGEPTLYKMHSKYSYNPPEPGGGGSGENVCPMRKLFGIAQTNPPKPANTLVSIHVVIAIVLVIGSVSIWNHYKNSKSKRT